MKRSRHFVGANYLNYAYSTPPHLKVGFLMNGARLPLGGFESTFEAFQRHTDKVTMATSVCSMKPVT